MVQQLKLNSLTRTQSPTTSSPGPLKSELIGFDAGGSWENPHFGLWRDMISFRFTIAFITGASLARSPSTVNSPSPMHPVTKESAVPTSSMAAALCIRIQVPFLESSRDARSSRHQPRLAVVPLLATAVAIAVFVAVTAHAQSIF